ncbi:Treh [Ramazzottius varieornatus]|uniref:Trehalase n=1 Tax=Ramazzottius varieornatus TaxID=947166 RepID=A0A1D1VT83_RAMVA|nr:Treh [Ramazzottius varieornatus]
MADTGARPLVGEDGQGVLEADLPDSLVSLPYPAIVSGGRFREANYWDSYWIVQGLLVSKLTDTARGVILNFADLIDRMGFVPAGNRVYYGRRSAPPVLALMVDSYRRNPHVTVGQGKKLVQETLPALEREYRWWMEQRNVTVRSADGQLQAILNVYRAGLLAAPMTHPRPEFYLQDVHRASNLSDPSSWDKLYRNGAAASESTWSSSSRWTDVEVEDIVPVDLNAFLCAYERQMAEFYHSTGNEKMAEEFQDLAKIRADAIHAFLWNDTVKMWRDYDVRAQKQRPGFYLSHIAPIFAHCSGKVNITSTDFLQAVFKSADVGFILTFSYFFSLDLRVI